MEATAAQHFKETVAQIFNRWTALKLSVEHGMGGKNGQQTAIEIMNYMYEYCTQNENLSQLDVTTTLEEIMDQEFDTICDDNSISEISAHLVKYLNLCKEQRFAEVHQEINQLPQCQPWLTTQFQMKYVAPDSDDSSNEDDDDDDDDDEDMDTSNDAAASTKSSKSKNTMETDADGWTTVPSRRRN